ncbi:cysteine--tRNA ligase [Candidatus Parcubacteria bacterium]|nr:cysteine--tRNA ligase [Candidatus Parcubacteria bacterium]
MIKLTNTLGGKKEEFKPIKENHVGIYSCGPTVYDYIHIGNLRAFLTSDILRRALEHNGFEVTQVMNITDVGQLNPDSSSEEEDKMTKGLKRENKPITIEAMNELAHFYTEAFKQNLKELNIKSPTHLPKASEHINENIELIKKLEEKGFTYTTSDGVYFDTSKDAQYGKLGGIAADDSHARINENSEKKNFRDFALWKFNKNLGYPSLWGQGFPGWHIECSAMSQKYLGQHFDIHTGGIDLAPIHHNNEIAQSENACGCEFANYWIHNAFLNIEGGKMAKSAGNFLSLQTLKEKNINPLAYRYWLLTAHYRTQVDFSWEALGAAQTAYKRLIENVIVLGLEIGTPNSEYLNRFKNVINDDLDTPKAVALIWELLKDTSVLSQDKRATLVEFDKVLGLGLDTIHKVEIPHDVQQLIEEREKVRKSKDYQKSDELRDKIKNLGFEVKDTDEGPRVKKL